MTENTAKRSLRESLSALVDDQATELELHRILKESENNAEVCAVWARYQLASTALRGATPDSEYVDLSDRIRAAIADEDNHRLTPDQLGGADAPKTRRWWQQAGRFAIAASVAGAVVIGAQQSAFLAGDATGGAAEVADNGFNSGSTQDQIPLLNPSARIVSTDGGQTRVDSTPKLYFVPKRVDQAVPVEAVQKRLNYLMLEHAEHAAQNSGRGMLPFARIPRMEEE